MSESFLESVKVSLSGGSEYYHYPDKAIGKIIFGKVGNTYSTAVYIHVVNYNVPFTVAGDILSVSNLGVYTLYEFNPFKSSLVVDTDGFISGKIAFRSFTSTSSKYGVTYNNESMYNIVRTQLSRNYDSSTGQIIFVGNIPNIINVTYSNYNTYATAAMLVTPAIVNVTTITIWIYSFLSSSFRRAQRKEVR